MSQFFHVNVRVHWADTDAAGIVWFGNFFRFFEEAEDELFRALGRTRLELVRDFDILMPRVEAACQFRSPARAEEILEVGIRPEELSERRLVYRFEVRERDLRRLVAEGSYRVACVSSETFKAREFPPAIRLLLKRFDELLIEQRGGRRRAGAGWV